MANRVLEEYLVKGYAIYKALTKLDHIIRQVFCHGLQLTVESQRGKPATQQSLLASHLFKNGGKHGGIPPK